MGLGTESLGFRIGQKLLFRGYKGRTHVILACAVLFIRFICVDERSEPKHLGGFWIFRLRSLKTQGAIVESARGSFCYEVLLPPSSAIMPRPRSPWLSSLKHSSASGSKLWGDWVPSARRPEFLSPEANRCQQTPTCPIPETLKNLRSVVYEL